MGASLPDEELVVATPERVSFGYQVAGLGTRALAQLIDLLIVSVILAAVLVAAFALGSAVSVTAGILIGVIGTFVVVFGYFWVSEAFWSGQTIGKKALRLRAVGDRGEPLTLAQAGIRNIVRLADFLPFWYGVGTIVLFANGRGKRLGDLAAGTLVVKDSDSVQLWQLAGPRPVASPPPPPPPGAPVAVAPAAQGAATQAELLLRRLDPELRRLVSSYARRRPELSLEIRAALAGQVQHSLRAAVPELFVQYGPLAALDYLATLASQ